jgi:hypothetical protein
MNNLYSTLNRSKKNTLPAQLHTPLPPPLPEKRKKPPTVNRKNKPEIIIFKEGIVEDLY